MIEIQNVSKRYGNKLAVNDVSFTIKKGEILGFLGRNGAGKSTTMNIVTGYISASSGRVLLDGHDILEEPREVKRRIGYLPEMPPLYMDMTVDEYLKFVCAIKDVKPSYVKSHLDDITELIRITDVRKRLIKNLSKGYKQRVGMAQALVGNPEVVIMDEPTVGLDPKQIIEIRKLIKQLGEDHTIVLSSHILHEVADVCERVVIINQGKIVAQDTLDNLTKNISDTSRFRLRIAGAERDVYKAIRDIPGTRSVDEMGCKEPDSYDFLVEADRGADIRRPLFNQMAKMGCPILMLRPMDIELEDIFLQLTTDKGEE
ncbi:MAG: ABC transporter ATP-binding protein [Clostridiales bacterium]|nr:ABC transporter ATP-binding protein [Clostridiales bacterium]MDD7367789.1 ABC transporter ATP-binding protein [Clostridiales bacterium]MDY2871247.1 ABC transporter ATP-binding protein [Eubacteriales bacterium]